MLFRVTNDKFRHKNLHAVKCTTYLSIIQVQVVISGLFVCNLLAHVIRPPVGGVSCPKMVAVILYGHLKVGNVQALGVQDGHGIADQLLPVACALERPEGL